MPKLSQLALEPNVLSSDVVAALRGYSGPGTGQDVLLPAANFAAIGTYLAQGQGAVPTTVQSRIRQLAVSVKDFGALGDGVTDDTAAIQLAINSTQAGVTGLYFPAGTYLVSSTLQVTGSNSWVGEARYACYITWTSTTLNVVNVNTNAAFTAENLFFLAPVNATAGSAITLSGPTSSGNLLSFFRYLDFTNCWNCINTVNAAQWTIETCYFGNYLNAAVIVQDVLNPDAGDSYIGSCEYINPLTNNTGIGVLQYSGGGLKIEGNKFYSGALAYELSLAASGALTSDLIIVGNSMEDQFQGPISLLRAAGSNTFGNVLIDSNQIATRSPFSTAWTGVSTDSIAGQWLTRVIITGNQFVLPASSGTPTFVGIALGSSVNNFVVANNEIFCQPGSGTPVNYGITVNASVSGGTIGVNRFDGSPWTLKIGNNAGAAVQVLPNSLVTANTAAFNVSTVSGALFLGSIAITFATPFDSTPVVTCAPSGVATGVSAYPSGVTKTGFTLYAFATTSQTAQTASWTAQGIL
jgi:hypothetical protein